jgi:hypothetical protein
MAFFTIPPLTACYHRRRTMQGYGVVHPIKTVMKQVDYVKKNITEKYRIQSTIRTSANKNNKTSNGEP